MLSIRTNRLLIACAILRCSSIDGTGINLGLTSGTVNWGMLEPFPDSIKNWKAVQDRYTIYVSVGWPSRSQSYDNR